MLLVDGKRGVFIVSHCEVESKQDLCWFPSHCVDLRVGVWALWGAAQMEGPAPLYQPQKKKKKIQWWVVHVAVCGYNYMEDIIDHYGSLKKAFSAFYNLGSVSDVRLVQRLEPSKNCLCKLQSVLRWWSEALLLGHPQCLEFKMNTVKKLEKQYCSINNLHFFFYGCHVITSAVMQYSLFCSSYFFLLLFLDVWPSMCRTVCRRANKLLFKSCIFMHCWYVWRGELKLCGWHHFF